MVKTGQLHDSAVLFSWKQLPGPSEYGASMNGAENITWWSRTEVPKPLNKRATLIFLSNFLSIFLAIY